MGPLDHGRPGHGLRQAPQPGRSEASQGFAQGSEDSSAGEAALQGEPGAEHLHLPAPSLRFHRLLHQLGQRLLQGTCLAARAGRIGQVEELGEEEQIHVRVGHAVGHLHRRAGIVGVTSLLAPAEGVLVRAQHAHAESELLQQRYSPGEDPLERAHMGQPDDRLVLVAGGWGFQYPVTGVSMG